MSSAREVAMLTLAACERQGAWSDSYLKRILREQDLDRRDAALATRLCFGVLQNKILLDWRLANFCKIPLERLETRVLCNLRVATYQLLFLDKIPPSAAVDQAVELTRKHCKNPRAAGMVNGILRTMLRQNATHLPQGKDELDTLSIRYSHPRWLVEALTHALGGEHVAALLEANNQQPPTSVQVNTIRFTTQQVMDALQADGITGEPHPWLPDCLYLWGMGNLERLEVFQHGGFYVQDCAARMTVSAAGVTAGSRVLDACASPGGKSFAAAIAMGNNGEIVSCDIHPHKIKLLEAGRNRLGLSVITPRLQNGTQYKQEWKDYFDTVLVDAPCSGLGIIRKKPDIRYKDPEALKNLPVIQHSLLDNCARYVKPGGIMLYSTCTLLPKENDEVIDAFLASHPQFVLEAFELPHFGTQPGKLTLWPHIHHTDGFFIAKLRRKG